MTKKTTTLVMLGAGGHAKVLVEALRLRGEFVFKTFDSEHEDEVFEFSPNEVVLVNGLGSVGPTSKRQAVFEKFSKRGYKFATIIHPRAVVAEDVLVGEGAQIMAGALVQTGVNLGQNVVINTGAIVDHDSVVGDHAHIAPGAVLSGGVKVGAGAHIGTGAVAIQNVSLGERAVVGAGSVVVNDIPSGVTAFGVPAKVRVGEL